MQKDPELPFDVLITTYELVLADIGFVSKFKWRFVVVDEAHRLKNPESRLYKAMMEELEMPAKLLLTGLKRKNLKLTVPRDSDTKQLNRVVGVAAFFNAEDVQQPRRVLEVLQQN